MVPSFGTEYLITCSSKRMNPDVEKIDPPEKP
jgi:hypothetical protein